MLCVGRDWKGNVIQEGSRLFKTVGYPHLQYAHFILLICLNNLPLRSRALHMLDKNTVVQAAHHQLG